MKKTDNRVVALHGYPRVGKDTIASYMRDHFGFSPLAFATPLKAAVSGLFGRSPEGMEPLKDTELDDLALFHVLDPAYRAFATSQGLDIYTPRTYRFHLKLYGTEYMQTLDPLRWVRTTIEALEATTGPVVITDLRCYEDMREIKALKEACARLSRPLSVWEVRQFGRAAPDSHPSNWLLPDYLIDRIVNNHNARLPDTLSVVASLLCEPGAANA